MRPLTWVAAPLACSLLLLPATSSASMFLGDWGVSYGNWQPTGFTGPHVNYLVEDYISGQNGHVGPGWGGQDFDVEAVYFGADSDHYYFAVVTGFPRAGTGGFLPGDLFVDRDGDGVWDFAFDTDLDGALVRGPMSLENPDAGGGQSWGGISDPFRVSAAATTPLPIDDWAYGAFSGRYAIEARIERSLVGPMTDYHVHWTMGCGNDAGDLYGSLQPTPTPSVEPVPEPATLLLVGLGIAGVAARRRRRDG